MRLLNATSYLHSLDSGFHSSLIPVFPPQEFKVAIGKEPFCVLLQLVGTIFAYS